MKDAHKPLFDHVETLLGPRPVQSKLNIKYPFRDRFRHTVRVYRWCERLLVAENFEAGEAEKVLISAIFHDSGYAVLPLDDHAVVSSAYAKDFLSVMGYNPDIVEGVCWLCENHSNRDPLFSLRTPSLSLLQDADRLDETGTMTVLWDSMAEGGEPEQSYEKTYFRLESMFPRAEARINELYTREAKRIYAQKIAFFRSFLDTLKIDLGLV